MVHAQVSEAYINSVLMYTEDHIFPVQPIKYLINEYGETTTPFKLATGKKLSISHLSFFVCFTKSYCTRWEKGVKHSLPSKKGFSWCLH